VEWPNKYRSIWILALLLISIQSRAQEYIPINFENSIWIEEFPPGFGNSDEKKQKYCKGDSILDDTTYFKLYESIVQFNPGTPDTTFHNYLGLIKNSANKTVTFIPENKTESIVIYDFNLNIGDTINGSYDHFIINEIDSVEICGKYHKRYIQDIGSNDPRETLIEGVGFSNGLLGYFESFDQYGESTTSLICFTETENINCSECDLIIKTQLYNLSIKLFPNPVENRLLIESSMPISELRIFNYLGIEQSRKDINDEYRINLNINGLNSGIYIVKVLFTGRMTKTYTLIKE
jgi:hypothetical protein